MQFQGSLEELKALVAALSHPGHWEHKGAYELFSVDEEHGNLRLNWWPASGELTLVGDPLDRALMERELTEALASLKDDRG